MGFIGSVHQHQASSTICPSRLFQSFVLLLPTSRKPCFERRKCGVVRNLTATTPSQGADVEKSNFVKPKWLLPAQEKAPGTEGKELSNTSLYQIILTTSKDYNSGISDLNAGILLAFIGEEGRCFMYRISALFSAHAPEVIENLQGFRERRHTSYRFQRGAKDVVTFLGPDVGRLEAVWIAPETGTWRIQGITVRVFPKATNEENEAVTGSDGCKNLQYNFELEEMLIGDNRSTSAAELLVSSIWEVSNEMLHVDANNLASQSKTNLAQVRDEGLKEYGELKLSLLAYDALLVIAGGAVTAVIGYRDVTEGYLIGGVLGFLYLFSLGKAVDQLLAPSNPGLLLSKGEMSEEDNTAGNMSDTVHKETKENLQYMQSFKNFRAPLTRLLGVFAICVVIVKAINPTSMQAVTKEMLFSGAAGFLMTKLATVLASSIPLSFKQVDSSQGKA